jgi:hypothetical protein
MAGAIFQMGMATGKFQGVITPTTPRGEHQPFAVVGSVSGFLLIVTKSCVEVSFCDTFKKQPTS